MRLKLYRALGVTEAMAQVRAELGSDALILATRRVADGVEVTAALDHHDGPPPLASPERERLLALHGIPPSLAAQHAAGPLEQALARRLRFGDLGLERREPSPLLFAGPPGAGKTLTVARVATRLVMAGEAPLVITADSHRAGATEQLAAFTRLLGLTLIVASSPATLARALTRRQPGAAVLIDAPGTSPFDSSQQDELTSLIATAEADVALVLPAGLDPAESADFGVAFAAAGATLLVGTRLDLARRLGGLLAAAEAGQLILTEAGVGPGAADGLLALTPALLAERLSRTGPSPAPAESYS